MRTNLKYVKSEKSRNGSEIVVKEYAEVNLAEILPLALLKKLPMVDAYMKSYADGEISDDILHIVGTGIAKCSPEDVFNEKTGFYIAQSRASVKVIKKYKKFIDNMLRLMETTFITPLEDITTKLGDAELALNDHINLDLIAE